MMVGGDVEETKGSTLQNVCSEVVAGCRRGQGAEEECVSRCSVSVSGGR